MRLVQPVNTLLLDANDPADLLRAAELLAAGQLVAVPTETVYGLAADARNPQAVAGIFAAKGRPSSHPLITHLAGVDEVGRWAQHVPPWVDGLLRTLWPGPLTVLLEKQAWVPEVITGGLPSIGLRMPAHPVLLRLMQDTGLALAAPSANRYQKLSPTTAAQVLDGLDGRIAAVLDGGPCRVGTESTILLAEQRGARILRAGPIGAAQLQALLPFEVQTPEVHGYAVPGNQELHYQPEARLFIKPASEILELLQGRCGDIGCLAHSPEFGKLHSPNLLVLPADHHRYRRELYASLHRLDRMQFRQIWVEQPPADPDWLDIRDRLGRAAVK